MAGSIHFFQYTADNGQTYHVRMDKSNGLVVGNPQLSNNTFTGVPRNITPRFAFYKSVDGKVTRRVVISSNAANIVATLPQSFTDPVISANGSGAVFLSAFSPERTKLPQTTDTGLLN